MAFPLLFSLSFLLLLLQPFLTFAQTRGNITIGASLSASQNSSSWLSPNGDFAFGFHSLDSNKDLFMLSIWYAKIPQKTIVWFANGDSPAASGTKVEVTADQGLVLTSPQ
ncbi:hypothetical protein WN943_009501 [Citrus x changshan-huyou]|uniref:Bulb-type lectin domain-containing protein n=1 Tax=Citrus unshiu TaxID=55188 RepID=A0A2H5PC52_CITUN|nr:hypothetical protein CUMW_122690 [Citrus unshiu]